MAGIIPPLSVKTGNILASLIFTYYADGAKPKTTLEKIQNWAFRPLCYSLIPSFFSKKYHEFFLANLTKTRIFATLSITATCMGFAWWWTGEKEDSDIPLPGLNMSTLVRTIDAVGAHLVSTLICAGLSKIMMHQLPAPVTRLFSILN